MSFLAFDTSNYTTSCAWIGKTDFISATKLLPVKAGELGLRQSDAVFAHIRQLPNVCETIAAQIDEPIRAVAVSTRPRNIEGSYMPCFLVGSSFAKTFAEFHRLPCFTFSHQEGHIAAVLYSSGNEKLKQRPFYAWHLSGGTTELLYVQPHNGMFSTQVIGGKKDISVGQLIDRTGKMLLLPFPSGGALDNLANPLDKLPFHVKVKDACFSLSGTENQIRTMVQNGETPEYTASTVLTLIAKTIQTATEQAILKYGEAPVIFTGGVSSSRVLREIFCKPNYIFGTPECSTDNAVGIAALAKWKVNTDAE